MPMAEMPNIVPALPELFLAGVIMLLLMFGVFQKGVFGQPPAKLLIGQKVIVFTFDLLRPRIPSRGRYRLQQPHRRFCDQAFYNRRLATSAGAGQHHHPRTSHFTV